MIILVTGATGNVGSEVVARLLANEAKVRVLTRDPSRAARWGRRVEVIAGEFADPDTFERAVSGVDAVFLMKARPGPGGLGAIVAQVAASGRPRLVLLSTCWVSPTTRSDEPLALASWHEEMEKDVLASGLSVTILRPSAFMTNALSWASSIGAEGVVYNPFADGKTAPIAPEDIARVAELALTDSALACKTLALTGPELLTTRQQVDVLAKILGRSIDCKDVPVDMAVRGMAKAGAPPELATAVGQSFDAVRSGRAATLTDTVLRVTGERPLTFEAWAQKNASRFGR